MIREVLVVGAGAVGGYFGAYLEKSATSTSFLLRGRTLEAVEQRGLTIREPGQLFTVRPRVSAEPSRLPTPDLIILSTKANDLDAALDAVAPQLASHTIILTLQNGIDTEARVRARVARDCVVGGVAYISSRVAAPGVIDVSRKGSLAINEIAGGSSDRVQAIADLFSRAGVPCHDTEQMLRTKWEKMCWNCVCNPLTVLLNGTIGDALAPERRPLLDMIVGEVAAVAAASGVLLRSDIAEQVVRRSDGLHALRTSMYEDWQAGRPTEIDHLNGYVARQTRALGLAAPLNELIAHAVTAMTCTAHPSIG